jgi:hypothetical protein
MECKFCVEILFKDLLRLFRKFLILFGRSSPEKLGYCTVKKVIDFFVPNQTFPGRESPPRKSFVSDIPAGGRENR